MSRKVVITGLGVISSIGNNVQENYNSLTSLRPGIGHIQNLDTVHKNIIPVSEVKLSDKDLGQLAEFDMNRPVTRTTLLGIIAAREAYLAAGLDKVSKLRTGFISATSVGGMGKTEMLYNKYLDPTDNGDFMKFLETHDCGESTERIAEALGIKDFMTTISTACSSSANSIMLGARMIKAGMLDRVVAGGVDSLTVFTINGFNTLMILDKEHCRPFDDSRQGLNLGEGAGYIVIESEEAAKAGNRPILAEVSGYANTNDAYHQTASSPDGQGAFLAMKKALQVAGLAAEEIDYINVHGTGTPNNDLSEGTAMTRLFGTQIPKFSSTKSYTGHTLGACGGIEAVYSTLSIMNKTIFPNLNFKVKMKELDLAPETSLISGIDIKSVLSNSFGFGGNNSALVFKKI
ncbi:beta-ACP synthase [Sporocytophaga myxococcoides]|uniref:Beta-ACP synthase n=1 Tax=Sporocytophaga myxococcoides TaxID=153721 RepID=A0A098LJB0_9BACT|nr:beta-ketoacyl-[acyl-carrier-protein] synthase family protein [Sporocytophaga myxococcoides]GAL87035.1 beta-ACP synthase [Sporocytophaga myxococcoides]